MAIKARAQKTLTKVFDGSGVFSIIITNENTSIPISNQGLPLNYSSTPTDAYVYSGTSLLTPVSSNPEAGQYTLTATGENISAGLVTINGNHASVANASNMSVGEDTYSITLTASGKDFLGNPFSAQKKQVITPLKRGDDATSYWENVTSTVITKDVKGNMTPDSSTVSAVYQSGMADPDSYKAIFKVYLKSGINFSTTPDYTSSAPESSYKITPKSDTNDIKVEMYDVTGTSLLDIQTIPVISQANGVISTEIVYTVTSTQVQPNDSANWSNTIPSVGKGQYLWSRTTFYYTDGSNAVAYSMGSNGKDGASASLLTLTSDSQAFTFGSDGKTPLPTSQTINFVANMQNVTGTATFVATPYSGTAAGTPISLGGTGNARTLTVSQFGPTYDSVVVKATLGDLSDTETVHKLTNGGTGKDAITGWLTNEAITLQADSNGNVPSYATATGSFVVYNGTNQVTGLTVSQSGATGVTLSISGMDYSVTGMTQDNAYVDLSVTTSGITIKKRLSLSKSKAGATGANGTSVVNSTTPPSNPSEGQWWNDLSVTPNILKVYQKGSWIPYRIDAINLVANSIKADNLAADVLLASNIKYTNSNGTTTNLQTFDFDGIKTLLSDNNGNTYTSMDTAVSSTQSWSALSKQVNSLGQINQLFNTEFSPDFAGWYAGIPATSGAYFQSHTLGTSDGWSISSEKYNGSNVINFSVGNVASFYSNLIPVGASTPVSVSMSAKSSSDYTGTVTLAFYLRYYDANKNYISQKAWNSNKVTSWATFNLNDTTPANTAYIVFNILTNGGAGTNSYSQPMMVFSSTVGDYVQGNYNNNDRVLKIEARADAFDVSIKGAQDSANTAQAGVNTLSQVNLINNSDFSPDTAGWSLTNGNYGTFSSTNYSNNGVGVGVLEHSNSDNTLAPKALSTPIPLVGLSIISYTYNYCVYNSSGNIDAQISYLDKDFSEVGFEDWHNLDTNATVGEWVTIKTNGLSLNPPTGAVYIALSIDAWGYGTKVGINQPMLVNNSTVGSYVKGDYGMSTATTLKLTADNYTLGIDANGNLISGITGNTQSVTIKGAMIHLDGNTVVDQGFFSLWNGAYGSTTIDSTGMEVVTGKAKTKFGDGSMSLISTKGENIGWIGRQVDSVYDNLDFLTFGLNGYHTTTPGDEHYDDNGNNTDQFYGGDGIIFGISTTGGGYLPLLQWNSDLAAGYRSGRRGWMFTQPIVAGLTVYTENANNDSNGIIMQPQTINNVYYPVLTSISSGGATGYAIGSGASYMYAGNNRILRADSNGYLYYQTAKTGSSGKSLLMASDGAIIAQSSATKYKSNIKYEKDTTFGDKLLTIDPATWSDKNEVEQISEYNRTGKEPDYAMNKDGARYYGLIAEDMVKAGLEELVVRDTVTGAVEGIQYEKIGAALIPLLREQRNQINVLRLEVEKLKVKINE